MKRYRVDAVRYSAPAMFGLAFTESGRTPGGRTHRWRWLADRERRQLQELHDLLQEPEVFPLRFEVVRVDRGSS